MNVAKPSVGSQVHGRLVLVATPIGNLGDLSPRAVRTLEASDIVCCEDTRRTRELLTHAGILHKRLLSLNAMPVHRGFPTRAGVS
jgi:16S rRNA C1402 (ribose-2'-O) methylase RsmI